MVLGDNRGGVQLPAEMNVPEGLQSPLAQAAAKLSRRSFVGGLGVLGTARAEAPAVGLAFGTYALWMLRWEDSLELISRTGYDGVEIAAMPDWPTAPERLSRSDRAQMRGHLGDLGLHVPAVLESLHALHPARSGQENLDRLRRAIDLGSDIAPGGHPFLETVLGRKPDEWEDVKNGMVDEIGKWVSAAASRKTVICFKPHVSHAVNNIERSLWLIAQIASPYFRCTFDYSHLWLAGYELGPALEALLPASPYLHLKDAARDGNGHRFLLPGDGETDYPTLFGKLRELGFRGYATVEISSHLHRDDAFEPIQATRTCYERMSEAMERAGLARP